ncbi:MAG: TetR family transcriptional regulator [Terrimonas ferruginea]|jgi:AcrR family transcriptional regulator|uniref:TetR/AcrR family transcriptional regulator n=1 Tax=Terrimonas ferruginea TaxID=249 RepID=UPI0003F89C62|nr:TetR/AcrR family transcriptional regulator [Terrimonas ferruginea]MBN8784487.1 TetR family transcriptional regulator [Terrimonas ferruginea]OJW40515.1 MAG: TetR family transcriptional regulator [Sphingobacteriales bacterium 48-107]
MAKTQRRKASKKELILVKAAAMFREKGFPATSMRDLAESVGIEAASLYNHIRSKNEILEAICFEVANRFNAHLDEIEASNLTSIQKVETLLRFHINQMIENYESVYVSDREWKHLEEPYLSNFQSQRRNYRKKFTLIIQQGIEKKEIRSIDAATSILIMLHAVSGIESWHRSKTKITAQELEDNMITIMIDGLRKQE